MPLVNHVLEAVVRLVVFVWFTKSLRSPIHVCMHSCVHTHTHTNINTRRRITHVCEIRAATSKMPLKTICNTIGSCYKSHDTFFFFFDALLTLRTHFMLCKTYIIYLYVLNGIRYAAELFILCELFYYYFFSVMHIYRVKQQWTAQNNGVAGCVQLDFPIWLNVDRSKAAP